MSSLESNFSVFIRNRGASDPAKWMANRTEIVRVQASPPKRYIFDHVFDHMCTQQDVFEQCAEPSVEEFSHGYNTTIFAYGQTGTGKTYTMTGDCSEPVSSLREHSSMSISRTSGLETSFDFGTQACLSQNAGLVPRVLASIFSRLGRQDSQDWILEMSFVELYNEELRDLFDYSNYRGAEVINRKPERAGRVNSSSQNSNSSGSLNSNNNGISSTMNGNNKMNSVSTALPNRPRKFLKVVENKTTRSVDVQGATTLVVDSLEYALENVRRALTQRETASTSLNTDSSRSHTILTLVSVNKQQPQSNVAIRSKLNLVDLAGSENVLKSGAMNKRAKEAGEINKSLLALGRVIEKLVAAEDRHNSSSNSTRNNANPKTATTTASSSSTAPPLSSSASRSGRPYISYRDSRLTHILQDSLGGSTKTVMIATVDSGSPHSDDSRNTLEYASKAKSIKNQVQTEMDSLDLPTALGGYQQKFIEFQKAFAIQQNREGVHISKQQYDKLRKDRQTAERLEIQTKSQMAEIEDLKRTVSEKNHLLDERAFYATDQCNTLAQQARLIEQSEAKLGSLQEQREQSRVQTRNSEEVATIVGSLESQIKTYVTKVEYFHAAMSTKFTELPQEIHEVTESLAQNAATTGLLNEYSPQLLDISESQTKEVFEKSASIVENHIQRSWANQLQKMRAEFESNIVSPTREHIAEITTLAGRASQAISRAINEVNIRADRDRQVESIGTISQQQNTDAQVLLTQSTEMQSEREKLLSDFLGAQTASVAGTPKISSNSHAVANDLNSTSDMTAKTHSQLVNIKSENTTLDNNEHMLDMHSIDKEFEMHFSMIRSGLKEHMDKITSEYNDRNVQPRYLAVKAAADKLESIEKLFTEAKTETKRPAASARHFQKNTSNLLADLKEFNRLAEQEISQPLGDQFGSASSSSSGTSIGSASSTNNLNQPNHAGSHTASPTRSPSRSPAKGRSSPIRNGLQSPRRRQANPRFGGQSVLSSPRKSFPDANLQFPQHLRNSLSQQFGSDQRVTNQFVSDMRNPSVSSGTKSSIPNSARSTVGVLARRSNSVQVPSQSKNSSIPQPISVTSCSNTKRPAVDSSPRLGSPAKAQKFGSFSSNRGVPPHKRPKTNQTEF